MPPAENNSSTVGMRGVGSWQKRGSSKDGGGVGMRRDSGLKFGSEAGCGGSGSQVHKLRFRRGWGVCGRTVGEGCDVGGARRVECDERSAGDRGANRRRNLPCTPPTHNPAEPSGSGRSVKGVSGNAEAEQRQRQGNFSIQEQEGRGGMGGFASYGA